MYNFTISFEYSITMNVCEYSELFPIQKKVSAILNNATNSLLFFLYTSCMHPMLKKPSACRGTQIQYIY